MGQKVNPNGFRYGITRKHNACWFVNKYKFADYLIEDSKIRKFISQFDREYSIGNVRIERDKDNNVLVEIFSSKPGLILKTKDSKNNLNDFVKKIQKAIKNKINLTITILPIDRPELNAKLIAEQIAIKIENRTSFRIAQKFAIRSALRAGAKGIKTRVSGRLNGADMARAEGYSEGEIKLHSLKQNVDYATANANTTYGIIGIKVWVSKGEILKGANQNVATKKN